MPPPGGTPGPVPSVPGVTASRCGNCGATTVPIDNFCGVCGLSLSETIAVATPAMPQVGRGKATVSSPTSSPPPTGSPGPNASRTSLYVVLGLVAAIIAAVVGVVVLTGGKDDEDARTDDTEAVDDTEADDTEPETTEPATTSNATTTPDTVAATTEPATTAAPPTTVPPSADEIAGAPVGATGTQEAPVAVGQIADIGAGWRLQVLDVVPDATAAIAAENEFNEPPPAGGTFTIVRVAMGYFGLDDPQSFFMPTIAALGSGGVELEPTCGVIPQPLDLFNDAFAGGVATGNLCFVTTPADPPSLMLSAIGDFADTQVYLDAKQPAAPAPPMASVPGAQPGATATALRAAATPVGAAAPLSGDWSFAVISPARDITDQVMAENSFNEPPPEGYRMLGIDVAIAYNGTGTGSAFDVTAKFVGDGNVQRSGYCGVVPDELDVFADVAAGSSITGTICIVVPAAELTNGVLYVTGTFEIDEQPVFFALG